MTLTHVLRPIKLGNVEIKNRVVRTPHTTKIPGGPLSEDYLAFHEARARGGVGLAYMDTVGFHRAAPLENNLFDPGIEAGYRRVIDRIKPYGTRLFQQVHHGGAMARLNPLGMLPWAPSDIASVQHPVVPVPMTKAMIDDVVEAYGNAARLCERWGLDGVEVLGHGGYLIHQFLAPHTNKRTDEYGGSIENRARFLVEVMQAVRSAVAPGFAVGVRLGPDPMVGGVGAADVSAAIAMLEARSLIDYVSVWHGNNQTYFQIVAGMHEPTGYALPIVAPIARGAKVPAIVTGRFRTLEEADAVIRSGDADMVGMTRAHIADPDIVRKTMEGRSEQIRPCIACNQMCIGNAMKMSRVGCTVNAGAGYERTRGDHALVPAPSSRRVWVIGGGPAGMEAARVAALRGHRVVLAEASARLGGMVNIAAKAPTRHGMADITAWLEAELFRLGVDVRLNSYMVAEEVIAERPDAVIVATGSIPRMDGVQLFNPGEPITGMDRPNVVSTVDLFTDTRRNLGNSAVVIDDVGHYEALGAAEYLVDRGLAVTIVSRHITLAPLVETALMVDPALQRMLPGGKLDVKLRMRAVAIGDDGVAVASILLPPGNRPLIVPADTVVFISYNRPNREIADALLAAGLPVRVVGDAHAPRFLPEAIHEGHLAGAET